jgi:hypothetical protein
LREIMIPDSWGSRPRLHAVVPSGLSRDLRGEDYSWPWRILVFAMENHGFALGNLTSETKKENAGPRSCYLVAERKADGEGIRPPLEEINARRTLWLLAGAIAESVEGSLRLLFGQTASVPDSRKPAEIVPFLSLSPKKLSAAWIKLETPRNKLAMP